MTAADATPVAVFDFDETLVLDNSLRLLYRELSVGVPLWWRCLPLLTGARRPSAPAHLSWYGRVKHRIKTHLYLVLCAHRQPEEIRAAARRVAVRLRPNPPVIAALAAHGRAGGRSVVASASPRLAVEAMLAALGLSVTAVIGTELEQRADRLTGALQGAECRATEKASRLRACLDAWHWPAPTFGYGNLPEDGPMLAMCMAAFAVPRGRVGYRAIDPDAGRRATG